MLKINHKVFIKSFFKDGIYNLIASLIYTINMQLIVMPFFGRVFSEQEYGYILLLIGISTVISMGLGNTLNNVRLILNDKYKKNNIKGDFNILLLIAFALSILFTVLILKIVIPDLSGSMITQMCIITLLNVAGQYYATYYYIYFQFKKVIIQNIIFCSGSLFGIFLMQSLNLPWTIVLILASSFSVLYCFCIGNFKSEPFRFTPFIKDTSKQYGILITSSTINNTSIYLDRFFLYPILGAGDVAVYATAAFFGKALSVFTSPFSNVLLGYLTKSESLNKKNFIIQVLFSLIICLGFYVISMLNVSKFITGLLYPTLISQATPYLNIANLTALLGVAIAIISPSILTFCDRKWQIVLNVINILIYISRLHILVKMGSFGFLLCGFNCKNYYYIDSNNNRFKNIVKVKIFKSHFFDVYI